MVFCSCESEKRNLKKKDVCFVKSLGIVRRIDEVGRIVLPKELRRMFDLRDDEDAVEIFVKDDQIILKKYSPTCVSQATQDVMSFPAIRFARTAFILNEMYQIQYGGKVNRHKNSGQQAWFIRLLPLVLC